VNALVFSGKSMNELLFIVNAPIAFKLILFEGTALKFFSLLG